MFIIIVITLRTGQLSLKSQPHKLLEYSDYTIPRLTLEVLFVVRYEYGSPYYKEDNSNCKHGEVVFIHSNAYFNWDMLCHML